MKIVLFNILIRIWVSGTFHCLIEYSYMNIIEFSE
jgi:hypothetical protein